jgi:hypothetical protein
VLTVEADAARVEKRLVSGEISCPGCGGELRPWGWAGRRVLRGEDGVRMPVRPRRAWCASCRATHVLLPVIALLRRADLAVVIGAALAAKAAGAGHRVIAVMLGRPAETVRGWLRSFARVADEVRAAFTVLLCALAPDPRPPGSAGGAFTDAVAAVLAAAAAVRSRWPELCTLSPWLIACAASNGQLIFPAGPRSSINISRLWARLM